MNLGSGMQQLPRNKHRTKLHCKTVRPAASAARDNVRKLPSQAKVDRTPPTRCRLGSWCFPPARPHIRTLPTRCRIVPWSRNGGVGIRGNYFIYITNYMTRGWLY